MKKEKKPYDVEVIVSRTKEVFDRYNVEVAVTRLPLDALQFSFVDDCGERHDITWDDWHEFQWHLPTGEGSRASSHVYGYISLDAFLEDLAELLEIDRQGWG